MVWIEAALTTYTKGDYKGKEACIIKSDYGTFFKRYELDVMVEKEWEDIGKFMGWKL